MDGPVDEQANCKPEAVALTIQLDSGIKDCLYINSDDDPKTLASLFSQKHNLTQALSQTLQRMIQDEMAVFKSTSVKSKKPEFKNIHDRLYMDSKFARRSNKKLDLSPQVHPGAEFSTVNYGQVMYDQSKGICKDKWREKVNIKNQIKSKEEKELTFHPSIPGNMTNSTANSEFFVKNKGITRNPFVPYKVKELQECSFRPKVLTTGQSCGNIHERLYRQAGIQKKIEKPMIEKKKSLNSYEERAECVNRLLYSHLKTQANIKRAKIKNGLLEPESLKNADLKHTAKCSVDENKKINGDHQDDIFHVYRIDCYKKIFELLDSDSDGFVSVDSMEIGNFEDEFVDIFLKYFSRDLGQDVNLGQFIEIMEAGVSFLNIRDRVAILRRR